MWVDTYGLYFQEFVQCLFTKHSRCKLVYWYCSTASCSVKSWDTTSHWVGQFLWYLIRLFQELSLRGYSYCFACHIYCSVWNKTVWSVQNSTDGQYFSKPYQLFLELAKYRHPRWGFRSYRDSNSRKDFIDNQESIWLICQIVLKFDTFAYNVPSKQFTSFLSKTVVISTYDMVVLTFRNTVWGVRKKPVNRDHNLLR